MGHGPDHVHVVGDQQVAQAFRVAGAAAGPAPASGSSHPARWWARPAPAAAAARSAPGRSPGAGAGRQRTHAGSAPAGRETGFVRPTSASAASTRWRRSAVARPGACTSRPSPTISSTVMRGDSDENGSWNTTCTVRRSALSARPVPAPGLPATCSKPREGHAGPAPPGPAWTCRSRTPRSRPASGPGHTESSALDRHELALAKPALDAGQTARVRHRRPRPAMHGVAAAGRRGKRARPRRARAAVDQLSGVGMLGLANTSATPPLLHHVAVLHHRHAVGKRRTRFRSCVISSTAMPFRACSSDSRSRICPRTVTSSAVVGSSASSSRACRPAPWRSSRAGAGRPRAGAGRRPARRAARDAGAC
jgi:hypothetical protein